jgi:predicted N-acetyltransferase YhbS
MEIEMWHIDLLADHPDAIPLVTDWFYGDGTGFYAGRTFADVEESYRAEANRDRIPLRLVAVENGEIVGTVVLREQAGWSTPDLAPGLGGLFVREESRGRGIGTSLIQACVQTAKSLGFDRLFATTATAHVLFRRAGWREAGQSSDHCGKPLAVFRWDGKEPR